MASQIELRSYEALDREDLDAALPGLLADYADLAARVPSASFWSSVADQLDFVLFDLLRNTKAKGHAARPFGAMLTMAAEPPCPPAIAFNPPPE